MPNQIPSDALSEIYKTSIDGAIPVLIDIQNDKIIWTEEDTTQKKGHFRLVSDEKAVIYKGNTYQPASISYTPPSMDGKSISSASIKMSTIDRRAVELIRSINEPLQIEIIAAFMKVDSEVYFYPLSNMKGILESVTWDGTVATFPITFDTAMDLNVPRDTASLSRCPSVSTE